MDMSNEDSTCFVGICKLVSPLYIKDISITDKTPGTKVLLKTKVNRSKVNSVSDSVWKESLSMSMQNRAHHLAIRV